MKSVDPSTGTAFAEHRPDGPAELEAKLKRAHASLTVWRKTPVEERARRLGAAGTRLRAEAAPIAALLTQEMGKTLKEARSEVDKAAWALEHFAASAPADLAPIPGQTPFSSEIRFDPLGLILGVMPWNFPHWQAVRFAAPALAAGNVVFIKPAENVCGSALALEGCLLEAGIPPGVFTTVLAPVDAISGLIADPRVAAVTLTGSARAGAAVAAEAGRHLKKVVLELGGSDPYLVFEDADLDLAAECITKSRLLNAGQSCIAAKRVVVLAEVRATLVERLVARFEQAKLGDPRDEATDLGPLAREDLRDGLARQVERSVAAGARVLVGGRKPTGPGWYYPPTVLTDIPPGAAAASEELFGPVLSVFEAKGEDDAVRLAHATEFGLGAAVFTADPERAGRIAASLDAGLVAVNDFVRSDPRLPFGGVKRSGFGRELSTFGLREWVNVKTVTHGVSI